MWVLER